MEPFSAPERTGLPESVMRHQRQEYMTVNTSTHLVVLGPPGTGKTHLSIALAVKAWRQGSRCFFPS